MGALSVICQVLIFDDIMRCHFTPAKNATAKNIETTSVGKDVASWWEYKMAQLLRKQYEFSNFI
jgi:hypothetical protein